MATPVGQPCSNCDRNFEDGDQGLMRMAVVGGPDDLLRAEMKPVHRGCDILGIVGHHLGVCGCTGYLGLSMYEAGLEVVRRIDRAVDAT